MLGDCWCNFGGRLVVNSVGLFIFFICGCWIDACCRVIDARFNCGFLLFGVLCLLVCLRWLRGCVVADWVDFGLVVGLWPVGWVCCLLRLG